MSAEPQRTRWHEARALLGMAWPLAISAQLGTFARLISTTWMGRLVGPVGLSAAALSQPIEFVCNWIITIISVGASTLVSRASGAGKPIRRIVIHAAALCLFASATLAIAGLLLRGPLATLLGARDELRPAMMRYLTVTMGALVFVSLCHLTVNLMISTGRTFFGLVRVLVDLVLLAVLTPVLTRTLNLGVAGPPATTALAHGLLLASIIFIVRSRAGELDMHDDGERGFDPTLWRRMLNLGAPVQLARVVMWICNGFIVRMLVDVSKPLAGAYGVALTISLVFNVITGAVGRTCGIQVGRAIGRGDEAAALHATRIALVVQIAVGLAATLAACFAHLLVRIVSTDPTVVADAARLLRCMLLVLTPLAISQLLVEVHTARGSAWRVAPLLVLTDVLAVVIVAMHRPGEALHAAVLSVAVSALARLVLIGLASRSLVRAP